jgi:D-serine deaminase-like pyridoxal phosphate-dependent protein
MAFYFARAGWDDITIAFPVNPAETEQIILAARQVSLNLLVEERDVVEMLGHRLTAPTGIFIKIDAGYHRTGIPVEHHHKVLELVQVINRHPVLSFKGLLAHNGHTYHAASADEIKNIHDKSLQKLSALKMFLRQHQIDAELSIGDTPSMSITENFADADEIRPGNFVFYDVMQAMLGSCTYNDIAVALACPVVARHPQRQEVVIYGGAVHLSKDSVTDPEGNRIFGKVVTLDQNGWSAPVEGTYVKALSQEHGIIKAGKDFFNRIKTGDFVGILPVHSCLTVNLMREYVLLSGEKITTAVK